MTAITSAAATAALVMSALTTFAVLARREAERQRGQAEALVEPMRSDLRDRLKRVGRLDATGFAGVPVIRRGYLRTSISPWLSGEPRSAGSNA